MTTILLIILILAVLLIRDLLPDEPSCRKHGTEDMRERGYDGETWCYICWAEGQKRKQENK